MQFVVEKQNAYFYIKTRTRKKPLRCQPGGWNSHLALPKSTGRTPGALQAPEQQNPAFSPTPNDAPVALQTTRDMGDLGGRREGTRRPCVRTENWISGHNALQMNS